MSIPLFRHRRQPMKNAKKKYRPCLEHLEDRTAPAGLDFATYFGGSGNDNWNIGHDIDGDVTVDAAGNVYVTGFTDSEDFPVGNAMQATHGGAGDAYVAKFDPAGQLLWSTYLGGDGQDYGRGITVDAAGSVYITGLTHSADFPILNAAQPVYGGTAGVTGGGGDAFVTKLTTHGALVYSTFLGGSSERGDGATDIAVDSGGNAYVTGTTHSRDFPTTADAFQPTFAGGNSEAFITKLNAAGSAFLYSTYLGGGKTGGWADEQGFGIAVDAWGNAYVTGRTRSADFPTVNPIQPQLASEPNWGFDVFVTKLNSSGSGLEYSTYYGGYGDEWGNAIAVDSFGNAYVTGAVERQVELQDFPITENAFQKTSQSARDSFVLKLDANGTGVVYSTYFGGSGYNRIRDIAVDSSGDAYISGYTDSLDFPIANPLQPQLAPGDGNPYDAFVGVLDADGTAASFSTYFGGTGDDRGIAITVDGAGDVYLFGRTVSSDLPTRSAWQPVSAGVNDAFIAKIGRGETLPTVSFTTESQSGAEDAGSLTVTAELSRSTDRDVIVPLQVSGTAADPDDYRITPDRIIIPAGSISGTATINIVDDALDEPDETVIVRMENPQNAALGAIVEHTATIIDNDPPATLAIDDVQLLEGHNGTSEFTFSVTLSAPSGKQVRVEFETADGSATVSDNDYVAKDGTLLFEPGETSRTVTVLVNGDEKIEPDEDFTVRLFNSINATLAKATGLGTIQNDDFPGSISGRKFHDLDRDGDFDADEPGLASWTIFLDQNRNGQLDDGERSTLTDEGGFYMFDDLAPGTYVVAEVMQPGWVQTLPGGGAVKAIGAIQDNYENLTNVQKMILAGDPNGTPADTPADRVDQNTIESQWAGVGSLNLGDLFLCTATAITRRHVLTAAHCLDIDDDGSMDWEPQDITFHLNYGSDLSHSFTASGIAIHPDFTGFGNPYLNDDIAVITLSSDLPNGLPIYELYRETLWFGDQVILVGYGTTGDGVNGFSDGTASLNVKRVGQNVVDVLYLDDELTGSIEIFAWDFDGPPEQFGNGPTGGPTLSDDIETQIGPGDSGGPSFIQIGGEWKLAGVNTLGFELPGFPAPNGRFTSMGGGMVVSAYADWIDSITGNGGNDTPGSYTVKLATGEHVENLDFGNAQTVSELRRIHGFHFAGSWWENFAGQSEKWFKDRNGDWFLITPDGNLYQWNGSDFDGSAYVAQLDPSIYADPQLLLDVEVTLAGQKVEQLSQLRQDHGFHFADSWWQNFIGQNEKWFKNRNGEWFLLTPDGSLYRWNGKDLAGSERIALVDPFVYDEPHRLFDAKVDLSEPTLQTLSQLRREHGFHDTGDYWFNLYGLQEKWFKDRLGNWFILTPDGRLQRWVGERSFTVIRSLDTLVYDDPNLLFGAQVEMDQITRDALSRLQRDHGFYFTGNDWLNFAGRNGKWFKDRSDQWFLLTPEGNLHRWDLGAFVLIETLDAIVYDDLSWIFGA